MTVLYVLGALLIVAAIGQAIRMGIRRGDWSGLMPVWVILGVIVLGTLLATLAPWGR